MSGGEQQMLTIARTLMGNPRCVLLDEPSEGLAPIIVEQMAAVDPRAEGRGAVGAAVRAEPAFLRRPSPTAPISSRRARSASAARWPSSPPTLRSANSIFRFDHGFAKAPLTVGIDVGGTFTDLLAIDSALRRGQARQGADHRRQPGDRLHGRARRGRRRSRDPAGHGARHDHDDQRAARTQDRQGRPDHHQGLPRRAGARPPHAAAALRPARHLPAADRARAAARSARAHGCRRQGADAARRGRRRRGGEEAAGAGLRGRRHPFPAQLHQSGARAPRRRDRARRCGPTPTSRRATPSCRNIASSSAA